MMSSNSRAIIRVSMLLCFACSAVEADEFPQIDESKYQLPGADLAIPAWAGKRSDEPFDVKAFWESRMPPRENAAPLYIYAMSQYSPEFLYFYPEEERDEVNRRTRAFVDRIKELSDREDLREIALSEEVEQVLKEAEPYLKLIDAAQKRKECVFVSAYGYQEKLPHAVTSRVLARLNLLAIANACPKEGFQKAEEAVAQTLRLSRDLRPRGPMTSQIISIAIANATFSELLQSYLPNSNLKATDCDRLLSVLQEHARDSLGIVSEGMRMDYIQVADSLTGLQNGQLDEKLFDLEKFELSRINFDLEWNTIGQIYQDIFTTGSKLTDRRELDQRLSRQFELLSHGNEEERSPGALDSAALLLGLRKFKAPVLSILLFPATVQFHEAERRHRVRLNAAILFTAVRRYELQHGQLPESLEIAAREAGLDAVPVDPYDESEGPMRYAILNGKPVVYSVARDGVDDGGKLDWKFGERPGDFLFKLP